MAVITEEELEYCKNKTEKQRKLDSKQYLACNNFNFDKHL